MYTYKLEIHCKIAGVISEKTELEMNKRTHIFGKALVKVLQQTHTYKTQNNF